MDMYTVRYFNPIIEEYAAIIAIHKAKWPDGRHFTVEQWREDDMAWPSDKLNQRFVVEGDNRIVAEGACYEEYWQHQPGTIHLQFNVHPDYENQGVDTLLYQALLEYLEKHTSPTTLATEAREDDEIQIAFLLSHYFQVKMRSPRAALDVTAFDNSRFQNMMEKVIDQDIHIYTLAELYELETDWKQKLCTLRWAIIQDVPSIEPPTPFTLAEFQRMILDDPALDPQAWFVAVAKTQETGGGGSFIGMSNLWINDPTYKRLDTGLTGVICGYRRRGIATVLKLHTIRFAQHCEALVIETSNEENNPMYDINLRLGFQPKPAWVSYRKNMNRQPK